jgi:hypothetical protein
MSLLLASYIVLIQRTSKAEALQRRRGRHNVCAAGGVPPIGDFRKDFGEAIVETV